MNEITIMGVIFLILAVICFYLYTRIGYTEKKVNLIENMLLDIKSELDRANHEEPEYVPEPQGVPSSLETREMEELPTMATEEDGLYQDVLEQVHASEEEVEHEEEIGSATTKITPNYESMTKAELTNLCKQRSLKTTARPGRAELISTLRKADELSVPAGVSSTNDIFPLSGSASGLEDATGFHVELGAETSE